MAGGDNIYAYSKSALKFKKVAATVTIPEGKCYLEIDGNGGDALDIIFDGEATFINDVNAGAEAVAPVKVLTAKGVQIGKFNVAGSWSAGKVTTHPQPLSCHCVREGRDYLQVNNKQQQIS